MSPAAVLSMRYYVDLAIKGFIAISVSIAGWHFKNFSDEIERLKSDANDARVKVSVMDSSYTQLAKQMERMDSKIDRVLERLK